MFCGVLPPGLVQYCSQHSCVIAVYQLTFDSDPTSFRVWNGGLVGWCYCGMSTLVGLFYTVAEKLASIQLVI